MSWLAITAMIMIALGGIVLLYLIYWVLKEEYSRMGYNSIREGIRATTTPKGIALMVVLIIVMLIAVGVVYYNS